jgi:hypothetical protein
MTPTSRFDGESSTRWMAASGWAVATAAGSHPASPNGEAFARRGG